MDRKGRCGECGGEVQVKCYCGEIPVLLCGQCAVGHFVSVEGEHRPQPVEVRDESCEVCGVSTAVHICTCLFPWISYCADCAVSHVSNDSGPSKHSLEPVKSKSYLHTASDLQSYYAHQQFIDQVCHYLTHNSLKVDLCISQVNQTAAGLISAVDSWKSMTISSLNTFKKTLNAQISRCLAELEAIRYEISVHPRIRLHQIVQLHSTEAMEMECDMVKYDIDASRVGSELGNVLKIEGNWRVLEEVERLVCPVWRGSRVVEFELPEWRPIEREVRSDYRFKSMGAWCKLNSGEVFICGGLIQHSKTEYLSSATLLSLSNLTLEPLPSLHHGRCRHGILPHSNSIYVFGGYCDEYMKSCERFDWSTQTWVELPDMKDGRDCVTAAYWKEKIYVVGYGANRLEVYDIAGNTMTPYPVSLRYPLLSLLLPKSLALLCIQSSQITLLLDSQLLQIDIDSQEIRTIKLAERLDKQWYFPCPPQISRGEVVFITVEMEVWRVNLTTSEIRFVQKVR